MADYPAVPIMEPLTATQKKHHKRLVRSALNRELLGDLDPMPSHFAPKRFPNPPSSCMDSVALRMLAIESAMFPKHHRRLHRIRRDTYSRWDLIDFYSTVSHAYSQAQIMLKGTDDILKEDKSLEAKNNRKNYGTMRLFKKDLRRFDLAKQAVQKEIEKNPIAMSEKSYSFLGFELAKYHDLHTQFEAAKSAGKQKLRSFLTTKGYATEKKYQQSIITLNLKLDDFYRFHKKTLDEAGEAYAKAIREANSKRWLEQDRAKARAFILKERSLTVKCKTFLLDATKDDELVKNYVNITTGGTSTWSDHKQSLREVRLVNLITDYMDNQAKNAVEADGDRTTGVEMGDEESDEAEHDDALP